MQEENPQVEEYLEHYTQEELQYYPRFAVRKLLQLNLHNDLSNLTHVIQRVFVKDPATITTEDFSDFLFAMTVEQKVLVGF